MLDVVEKTGPLVMIGDWVLAQTRVAAAGFAAGAGGGVARAGAPATPASAGLPQPGLAAIAAAGGVQANFKLEDFTLEPQPPRFLLELQGGLAQLGALLQCAYGPRIMTVGVTAPGESVWLPDPAVATATRRAISPPKARRWPACNAAASPDRTRKAGCA